MRQNPGVAVPRSRAGTRAPAAAQRAAAELLSRGSQDAAGPDGPLPRGGGRAWEGPAWPLAPAPSGMKIAALRCETRKLGPINADRSKSDVIRMYIHLELDCMEATGQQRPHREEKACGSMRAWEGAAGEGGGPGGSAAGCPASDRVGPSFLTALRRPRSSGRLLCRRPEGSSRGGAERNS